MQNFQIIRRALFFVAVLLGAHVLGVQAARAQVINCPSGFNTTHGAACAISAGSNSEDFFSKTLNYGDTGLNGTAAILTPASSGHACWSLIRQTKVTNTAFTAHWQFKQNALNHAFVLENQTNQNGQAFCSGAGDEAGFFQGANGGNIQPNFVWGMKFDSYQPLTTGSFSYSNVQQFQTLQTPVRPPTGGSNYIPEYQTNAISTSPVPLNSPATTQETTTGDVYDATVTYNHGTGTLTLNLFDVTAGGSCPGSNCFTNTWTGVWIPEITGASTAWTGFTAGTSGGGVTSPYENDILNFTYTVNTPSGTPTFATYNANQSVNNGVPSAYTPVYSVAPGSYTSVQTVSLSTSGTPNNYICYEQVAAGSTPALYPYPDNNGGCAAGTLYSGTITVSTSSDLYAVAGSNNSAFTNGGSSNQPGLGPPSAITKATYTISSCAISAGASQSGIVTALENCSSGQTLNFPAGSYGPITSSVTIPNGVSMSGPVVPYSQTPNQTAKIVGSSSFDGPGFITSTGSNASSINYLEWDGQQPSNGGAFIQIVGGTNNFTIANNYLHGASGPNPDTGNLSVLAGQIRVGSGPGSTVSSNININNNIFGSPTVSDCGQAMNETKTEDSTGGLCNGVVLNGIQNGVYVRYNIFRNLEEGTKLIESTTNHGSTYNSGTCELCYIEYNHYQGIQRIPIEAQSNGADSSHSTLMYVRYNDFVSRHTGSGGQQNYDISDANGCANVDADYCITHTDSNVDVANIGPTVGLEIWGLCDASGTPCTTASNNLIQGSMFNGITWDKSGHFQFYSNNFQQNSIGGNTNQDCTLHEGGYWNWDGADGGELPAFAPDCTIGNTYATVVTPQTSSLPTMSPGGGTVSVGTVVTLGTTSTNPRDVNTSDWCTTDGTTPVVGGAAVTAGNTATIMTSVTITANPTVVKCIGMWGAFNQPYSYPSGYGYIPSSVVTNTYSTSGTPTAATPSITPATGTYTGPQTVTITDTTPSSTIYYTTNGSTPTTSSTVYSGSFSATPTITVKAIAAASGYTNSAVASVTYTATASPTLTGCYQGNTGNVNALTVGQMVQQHAFCSYSSGTSPMDCTTTDANGDSVTAWGATNGNITVGATGGANPGLVTGISAGTANSTATVSGSTVCSQWTWTVSAPLAPPTGVSVFINSF